MLNRNVGTGGRAGRPGRRPVGHGFRLPRLHAPRCCEPGFTLLEVLVTILVVSIGLLGLARAQVASLQFNHSAHLRSQATFLMNDILDRMRSNSTAAVGGHYTLALGQAAASPGRDCGNPAQSCSPAEMAAYDRWQWKQDLAGRLPGGDGAVQSMAGAAEPGSFVVTVRWRDDRSKEADAQFEDLSVWTRL